MANTVLQIRRTSISGRTPNTTTSANTQFINQGELALNMADFKMFSSNGSAFFEIGANVSTKFVGNSTASGLTANSTGIYSPLLVANIVALNVTTIVSGGTTTTMTASSTSYQHITGTSTQTIKLPDLTTIPTGSAYIIDNDSTSNVTITDSAGTTLIVATTGMAGYIYSMSNATATGNWGGYAYLPVGAQWGDAGLSYRGYFAVGNTTTANTFVINSTALSTVFSATFSNTVTISNNITFSSGGRIVDSTGSQGTSGQVLTSNGTGNVYWSTVSGGGGSVNVNSTYNFTNTITFSNSISLPVGSRILDSTGSQGAVGQVLYSNGSGNVYWGAAASGGSGVNTAYQYGFTNTISFYANVNIVGNSTSELVIGNSSVYVIANSTTIAGTGTSANTTITANGFVTTFDTLGNFYPANNLYIANGSTIIANGAPGSNGQVLTSNGTGIYWAAASGGGTGSNNRSVSSNTTVTLTDDFILATGPVTITLLSASTGKKIYIQNAANTGPVTILPNGTDTIGNQANLIIAYRRSSVGLQPNSTDWVKF